MEKISGVVIAYNEEKRIEDCLKSLQSFCDEIVLVDSFSTDFTLEIASKYTSRIYQRKFDTYVAQKSYATSLAKNKWVFWLDADERISADLLRDIIQLKTSGFKADAYMVHRLSYYINGFFKYSGWYPDAKVRLYDRTFGNWGGGDPHEKIILNDGARVEKIRKDVIHFTYHNLHHQIDKGNRLTTQAANQKLKRNQKFLIIHLFINPVIKLFKSYIIQGGICDGSRGFINSVIAAFDVFSKYAKVWEGIHEKEPNFDVWAEGGKGK